jgi:V-type H+-transporting ATPase subunit A
MLRNMISFYDLSLGVIERSASGGGNADGQRVTFNVIRQRLGDVLYKLASQKFEDPADGEAALRAKFGALREELRDRFRALEEEYR